MSRIYRDYFSHTLLTIPDTFIDVKTGDSQTVAPKVIEEIEYHSKNNTLQHLIFSALQSYLYEKRNTSVATSDVLLQLLEIKRMLNGGGGNPHEVSKRTHEKPPVSEKVDLKEIEDLLEAFGG
ncbi:hypothetical protein LCL89_10180 [Halobacillus yeomjeoni]|uniref:hypothetical protein n=1 Tax=Halobacillus yeomjeoni TaxID=311194 RepID=UPI001CD66F85|nr:hypothetical protein [Halobacillus yeomjeoni]MCA0984413.1 hypothetical protein [Halobacillus yeomjeoni]